MDFGRHERDGLKVDFQPVFVARRASAQDMRLDTARNKTGANDAGRLALLGPGRFLAGVPGEELRGDVGGAIASQAIVEGRALTGGRGQPGGISSKLASHVRGVMKRFGRIVAKGGGRILSPMSKPSARRETPAAILLPLAF